MSDITDFSTISLADQLDTNYETRALKSSSLFNYLNTLLWMHFRTLRYRAASTTALTIGHLQELCWSTTSASINDDVLGRVYYMSAIPGLKIERFADTKNDQDYYVYWYSYDGNLECGSYTMGEHDILIVFTFDGSDPCAYIYEVWTE